MQLNDVIESIGWYRAFAVLPIQTDITKNSTDTNTNIGIGASLPRIFLFIHLYTAYLGECYH